MRSALFLILTLCATVPAMAQTTTQQPGGDVLHQEEPNTAAGRESLGIMDQKLPYRDHQIVHYFQKETGAPMGWATRRGNAIFFYNHNGDYLGKAVRRTQAKTVYFASDGTYLGYRIRQKMLTHGEDHTAAAPVDPVRAKIQAQEKQDEQ